MEKYRTSASQVFSFDHTVRRSSETSPDDPDNSARGPVQRVHTDQSYAAARNRVSYHLPSQAPKLLKGRYQIINVWRPIKPILRDPLAVADAKFVLDTDLVPIKLIYPDREGETLSVRANPGIWWFYRYSQGPGLVTLIKCFDSMKDGRARRVPHSAFVNEGMEGEVGRESIEVGALIFHEDAE